MFKLFVSAACIGLASAFNPGATLSMDFDTLTQAKDVFFSYMLKAGNEAKMEKIIFPEGFANKNFFHVSVESKKMQMTAGKDNSVTIAV
jgi:hypothetical protein